MICRVAIHEQTPGPITGDDARGFRDWMKDQPGFVGGYHAQDSETGRVVSITVWDSEESMMSLKGRTPPGGPVGMALPSVELFDVVEEF